MWRLFFHPPHNSPEKVGPFFFCHCFFLPLLFSRKQAGWYRPALLGSLQARRPFLYRPGSRYACGREGSNPDRLVGTARLVGEGRWPPGGVSPARLWCGKCISNNRLVAKDVAAAWINFPNCTLSRGKPFCLQNGSAWKLVFRQNESAEKKHYKKTGTTRKQVILDEN